MAIRDRLGRVPWFIWTGLVVLAVWAALGLLAERFNADGSVPTDGKGETLPISRK